MQTRIIIALIVGVMLGYAAARTVAAVEQAHADAEFIENLLAQYN
jgi:uncharacterized membrane-anchored protein YhcB (DUF1043 family)